MSLSIKVRLVILASLMSFAAHAQESLSLMAWNVFMLPPPIKFSKQKERAKLQINSLKTLVNENDVLVLTETFQGRYKKQLLRELEEFYPYYYIQKRKGSFFKSCLRE